MNFYDIVRQDLKADEGQVDHAYTDSEGFWTIGIGRCIDKRKGGCLRQDEIDLMFSNDLIEAEGDARFCFPNFDTLSDNRKAVLMNMAFNLGRGGLYAFKKLRKAVEEGDFDVASHEMANSLWARRVPRRAQRLIKRMKEG